MFKYTCLNPIADIGLNNLTDEIQRQMISQKQTQS